MLKIFEKFDPRANPADGNYPFGSLKNESVPGAKDGTPLDKDWGNDYAGFDAALVAAGGVTPTGAPDTAVSSQRLLAMINITGMTHESVAVMKSDDLLTAGMLVKTAGYFGGWAALSTPPMGGGEYDIVTLATFGATPDGFLDHALDDLVHVAVLRKDRPIFLEQCGATGDGVTDDFNAINASQVVKDVKLSRTFYATSQEIQIFNARRIFGSGEESGFKWIGAAPASPPDKSGGTSIIRVSRPDPLTSALSNVFLGDFSVDLNNTTNLIGTSWMYATVKSRGQYIKAIGLGANCFGHYYSKLWYAGFDGMTARGVTTQAGTVGHYISATIGQVNEVEFARMQALGCENGVIFDTTDNSMTAILLTGGSMESSSQNGIKQIGVFGIKNFDATTTYFEGNTLADIDWGGSANGMINWDSCQFNSGSSKVIISDGNHRLQGCDRLVDLEINGGNVWLDGNSTVSKTGTGLAGLYHIPVVSAIDSDQVFEGSGIKPKGGASSQVRSSTISNELFPIPAGLITGSLPAGGRVIKVEVVGRLETGAILKVFEGYITQATDNFWRITALSTSSPNDAVWDVGVGFVSGDIEVTFTTAGNKAVAVSWEPF